MSRPKNRLAYQIAQRFRVGTRALIQTDGGPGESDRHIPAIIVRHGHSAMTIVRYDDGTERPVHRSRLCKVS